MNISFHFTLLNISGLLISYTLAYGCWSAMQIHKDTVVKTVSQMAWNGNFSEEYTEHAIARNEVFVADEIRMYGWATAFCYGLIIIGCNIAYSMVTFS